MSWKRLTFVIIPHSRENIKQVRVKRTTLYGFAAFLIVAIVIMVFYIIGFKGKSFYRDQTRDLLEKNEILKQQLVFFDSSLVTMRNHIAAIESLNKVIIEESDISDLDMKSANDDEINISENGLILSPARVLTIIDRMNRESEVFEYNYTTLYDHCMRNVDFLKHVPSIRPAEGVISKEFGRSFDHVSQKEKMHHGIDIHNTMGTPVVVTADGVVETIDFSEELGRYILIDHQNGYKTRYAHLELPKKKQATDLKIGDTVTRGQPIGTIGRTGIILQPLAAHLMYTVYHHSAHVNPTDYFFASDPVALFQKDISPEQTPQPLPE